MTARWRVRVTAEGTELLDRVLPEGSDLVLGRQQEADLQVREQSISRRHCRVRVHEEAVELRDLASANGIRIGNDRLREARLGDGESVMLGNVECSVHLVSSDFDRSEMGDSSFMGSRTTAFPMGGPERTILDVQNPDQRYGRLATNRLAVLVEASKSLASVPDLGQLFERILDHVFEILKVKRAVIALVQEDGTLSPEAVRPVSDDRELSSICSQTILGRVVRSGEAVRIDDAMNLPARGDITPGQSIMLAQIRAALAAPLLSHDRTVGVLYVDYPGQPRLYDDEDLSFLAAFAGICGVAVESARVQTLLRAQERLHREFELATDIQHALLPLADLDHPLVDLDWTYRPCQQVGGDFYDHMVLDDGCVSFVLGDVSGKGMPAALRMVRVISIFRAAMADSRSPAEVMTRVNRFLQDPHHDLARETGWFATAFHGVLDPRSGRLIYAAAGHPGILLGGSGESEVLAATGLPLRVLDSAAYTEREVSLDLGGVLALFTDGVTETSQRREEQFGEERVQQLLGLHRGTSSRAIVRRILEAIDKHVGEEGPRMDDMALLVVQRKPPGT